MLILLENISFDLVDFATSEFGNRKDFLQRIREQSFHQVQKLVGTDANYNQIFTIFMNRSKSKKGKSHQLPLFIIKLLEMVEDQAIQPVISWTSGGDSFNIKNVTKFTEEVLPNYFKHKNFSSFIRQLNMYGFRKIRHEEGDNVYMNEHFRVGSRNQLRNINRRIREQREDRVVLYTRGGRQKSEIRELSSLKSKQKNLEQLCKHMIIQNQRLMQQNQNLVKKIENDYRDKEKRMEDFLLILLAQKHTKEVENGSSQPLQICFGDFGKHSSRCGKEQMTPLEVIGKNMEQTENFHRVRGLIDHIYGRKNAQNTRQGNFTIMNQENDIEQPIIHGHHDFKENSIHLERDDDGFLSINSFMDADDFSNEINLEESR